jgi:hypothetical protein
MKPLSRNSGVGWHTDGSLWRLKYAIHRNRRQPMGIQDVQAWTEGGQYLDEYAVSRSLDVKWLVFQTYSAKSWQSPAAGIVVDLEVYHITYRSIIIMYYVYVMKRWWGDILVVVDAMEVRILFSGIVPMVLGDS